MRQARRWGYLVVVALFLLTAACSNFPGMRTSMPPPPAEASPGTAALSAPGAPDLAQRVQDLEARVQQMESRLKEMEGRPQAAAASAPRPLPPPSTAVYPKSKVTPSSGPAEKYYTEGMRAYHAKKYGDARNQLFQYLKKQPKGPRAPEARYYLADSFYQEGKYREAAVEFNKLGQQFPKSILAPAGLLRQALCYKSQHQAGSYRNTLRKLAKAYPNSPEAKEAKKLLKEGAPAGAR